MTQGYKRGYIAIVRARTGLLLGGGKVAESWPFEDYQDAVGWSDTCVETNQVAGRDAVALAVRMVMARRPILHTEVS
jgi:hypothetical protein